MTIFLPAQPSGVWADLLLPQRRTVPGRIPAVNQSRRRLSYTHRARFADRFPMVDGGP